MSKVIAIACDIECSTLYDKIGGDLLSMAFVEILEGYTLGREICRKSRATNPIYFNDESTRVHGFSYWKAVEFPKRIDSIIDVLKWLKPLKELAPFPFIYHANAKFDWRWLEAHFRKENAHNHFYKIFPEDMVESTLKMSRDNIKHIKKSTKINPISGKLYTDFSLRNVSDHYDIRLMHHEALSDARACAHIWCNIKQSQDTWSGRLF